MNPMTELTDRLLDAYNIVKHKEIRRMDYVNKILAEPKKDGINDNPEVFNLVSFIMSHPNYAAMFRVRDNILQNYRFHMTGLEGIMHRSKIIPDNTQKYSEALSGAEDFWSRTRNASQKSRKARCSPGLLLQATC